MQQSSFLGHCGNTFIVAALSLDTIRAKDGALSSVVVRLILRLFESFHRRDSYSLPKDIRTASQPARERAPPILGDVFILLGPLRDGGCAGGGAGDGRAGGSPGAGGAPGAGRAPPSAGCARADRRGAAHPVSHPCVCSAEEE